MKLFMLAALSAVVWSGTASALTMTCKQAESQQIKSLKGDKPVSITFRNSHSTSVQVIWLNYEATGQVYKTLAPGESYTQQTFMTHPWVFLENTDAHTCLGVYIPDNDQNTHVIQ